MGRPARSSPKPTAIERPGRAGASARPLPPLHEQHPRPPNAARMFGDAETDSRDTVQSLFCLESHRSRVGAWWGPAPRRRTTLVCGRDGKGRLDGMGAPPASGEFCPSAASRLGSGEVAGSALRSADRRHGRLHVCRAGFGGGRFLYKPGDGGSGRLRGPFPRHLARAVFDGDGVAASGRATALGRPRTADHRRTGRKPCQNRPGPGVPVGGAAGHRRLACRPGRTRDRGRPVPRERRTPLAPYPGLRNLAAARCRPDAGTRGRPPARPRRRLPHVRQDRFGSHVGNGGSRRQRARHPAYPRHFRRSARTDGTARTSRRGDARDRRGPRHAWT